MINWENFTIEQVYDILYYSKTFKEVAEKIGRKSNGKFNNEIREKCKELNISPLYIKKVKKSQDYIGETHGFLKINGIDKEKMYYKLIREYLDGLKIKYEENSKKILVLSNRGVCNLDYKER